MHQSLTRILVPIALLAPGCSQEMGERAWYYVYLNHVSEYDTATRRSVDELKRLGAEGNAIDIACSSLIALVDSIEDELLRKAGQVDIRIQQTDELPDLDKLMSYEVSTALMIGDEPSRPDTGSLSAYRLKLRIQAFVGSIAAITDQDQGLYSIALSTDDIRQGRLLTSWEAAGFYHLPLICVMDRLNDIKLKVRCVEIQALACHTTSPKQLADDKEPGGVEVDH